MDAWKPVEAWSSPGFGLEPPCAHMWVLQEAPEPARNSRNGNTNFIQLHYVGGPLLPVCAVLQCAEATHRNQIVQLCGFTMPVSVLLGPQT